MKHLIHSIMLFAIVLAFPSTTTAHDFSIDGVYYRIPYDLDFDDYDPEEDQLVYVTYRGEDEDEFDNEYSGDVVIPETVTYRGLLFYVNGADMELAQNCTELTSIRINDRIRILPTAAFNGCSKLHTAVIGARVVQIESAVFMGCKSLKSVTCLATEPPFCYGTVFSGFDMSSCSLTVPTESIEKYKNAPVWRNFGKINGIEASISEIDAPDSDPEYYTLTGLRVEQPTHGVYICIKGDKITKITL